MQTIQYGIGKEYLKDWGINEALREIYQNFLDFGEYTEIVRQAKSISENPSNKSIIYLSNEFKPTDLSFLRIGNSFKENNNAIGKHGEGLKMAFLVLLREGYNMKIKFERLEIKAQWYNQDLIGETLCLTINPTAAYVEKFTVIFSCNSETFTSFRDNIIQSVNKTFTSLNYGSIVNKQAGNLYSGGLFVCHLKNLKKAYDINPSQLKLDRDRRIPGAFDVNWATSKINEEEGRFNFVDQNYDDTKYMSLPQSCFNSVKATEVKGQIEFVAKVIDEETKEEKEVLITNSYYKDQLKSHSFFDKAISKIKNFLASKLGVKDLLVAFRDKHCNSEEAKRDFDILVSRLGIELPQPDTLPF